MKVDHPKGFGPRRKVSPAIVVTLVIMGVFAVVGIVVLGMRLF